MRGRMKVVVATLAGATLLATLTACTGNTQVNNDLNAIATAQDTAATTLLLTAMVAATTYSGTAGSGYTGFDAATAAQEEPGLKWTDGASAQNVVAIRGVTATDIVLVTKSVNGDPLCLAESAAGQTKGKVDAKTPAECTGGW